MKALIYANKQGDDEKTKKYDSKIENIISLVENMMHQNQNSSPEKVESLKAQGSDTSYLFPASFTAFTPSDQDCDPTKWEKSSAAMMLKKMEFQKSPSQYPKPTLTSLIHKYFDISTNLCLALGIFSHQTVLMALLKTKCQKSPSQPLKITLPSMKDQDL